MYSLLITWIASAVVFVSMIAVIRRKYRCFIIFASIAILLNICFRCFAFGILPHNDSENTLRVLTFNMNGEHDKCSAKDKLDFIIAQKADIVYLAEDFYGICVEVDSVLSRLYPYSTYDYNLSHYFYSKYPFTNSARIAENVDEMATIVKTSVVIGRDSLVLVGCHLSSNNYTKDRVDVRSLSGLSWLISYFESINYSSNLRLHEAEQILSELNDLPTIVMGDMNDVCGSPCMKVFADAGLRDSWWEGGFGYGATIHRPLPYRIDYVLYSGGFRGFKVSDASLVLGGSEGSNGLTLKGIKKVSSNGLSDHDALVAEFELR